MESRIIQKLTLSFLILLAGFGGVFAQTANQPQNGGETQILGEDERIPFMQTQEAEKPNDSGSGSLILRTFGAMFLIVGLIFFGAWALKKSGFVNSPANTLSDAPDLRVLNTVSLGSGKTLSIVQFGEKILLVGSTAQTFTLLAEDRKTEDSDEAPIENFGYENPRSVAELLAEENFDFEKDFDAAREKLLTAENGGKI